MKRYLIHSIFGCIMLWVIVKVRMCVKIIYYRYHVSTYIDLFRELPAAHRVSIERKCPYIKKLIGKGNFPSYFDNDDVTYILMPNFGFDIGQEELES